MSLSGHRYLLQTGAGGELEAAVVSRHTTSGREPRETAQLHLPPHMGPPTAHSPLFNTLFMACISIHLAGDQTRGLSLSVPSL